jgi:hypothetical protein
MLKRLVPLLAFALLTSLPLLSQETGDDGATNPDSTDYPVDTTYYEEPVDTTYEEYEDFGGGGEMPTPPADFGPGGGFYIGPTFEFTSLSPAGLDPQLDGDLVLYGVQLYAIIKGWMLGGHWTSATLYDMSTNYDQFEFSYGGFLTGYDVDVYGGLSFRLSTLIGGGDLNMIKKRPDLGAIDSTDNEILERYRTESFFVLRPGASIGFSPLNFLDLRLAVDYLYPIGGDDVHDLKKLTYGLHVMLGFGK